MFKSVIKTIVATASIAMFSSVAYAAPEIPKDVQAKLAEQCFLTAKDNNIGTYNKALQKIYQFSDDWKETTERNWVYYPVRITEMNSDGADVQGIIRIDFTAKSDNGGWGDTTTTTYSKHYECGWSDIAKGEYRIADVLVEYEEKGQKGNMLAQCYNQSNNHNDTKCWANYERTKAGNDLDHITVLEKRYAEAYYVRTPKAYWEWK